MAHEAPSVRGAAEIRVPRDDPRHQRVWAGEGLLFAGLERTHADPGQHSKTQCSGRLHGGQRDLTSNAEQRVIIPPVKCLLAGGARSCRNPRSACGDGGTSWRIREGKCVCRSSWAAQ